jgi:16S rRNA (uracil1498-N3)-methyltransferase
MTHRFFVSPERVSGNQVEFADDQRKQMRNVLRLTPVDQVAALDGSGREYLVELRTLDAGQAAGRILDVSNPATEPRLRLTLIQSLPKGEKLDLILRMCTEIGVSEFIIAETERSVPRIAAEKLPARLDRWSAIIREAAEQSGRTKLPTVEGVLPFREALARARNREVRIIAGEAGGSRQLIPELGRLREADSAALAIGPEGGFTDDEMRAAENEGFLPVSLGPRTLRTETAAIAAAALILCGSED